MRGVCWHFNSYTVGRLSLFRKPGAFVKLAQGPASHPPQTDESLTATLVKVTITLKPCRASEGVEGVVVEDHEAEAVAVAEVRPSSSSAHRLGADERLANIFGRTPLYVAVRVGHVQSGRPAGWTSLSKALDTPTRPHQTGSLEHRVGPRSLGGRNKRVTTASMARMTSDSGISQEIELS